MGRDRQRRADVVVIGTGAGGGTLAYGLRDSGATVLLLERGDFLPVEPENWSPEALFLAHRYKANETWLDAETGQPFQPGIYYVVGGNTKVYGAALPRLRPRDFGTLEHAEGVSPAWPITYDDLEPYYAQAETLYLVHGQAGADPTDGPRSAPYPFPPMPSDPYMDELATKLADQGLHPFPLPIGVDLRPGGRCIRCRTCDAFPCRLGAKGDAETRCVRPALEHPNVELLTRAFARRLLTDPSGRRIQAVEVERDGETFRVVAGTFVVACGAVNSAALLLRSANAAFPHGLGNRAGLVGRNYMVHNNAVLIAVHPTRRNPTVFQKSFAVNDFYFAGRDPHWPYPMGNLQPVGKIQAAMLASVLPRAPRRLLAEVARRSTDWWVMSEDLPDPENRITVGADGRIHVRWRPTNTRTHRRLIETARRVFRRAGYPVVLTRTMGIETNSHQVGTVCFGTDPKTAALDPLCRTYDHANLYVVDASFFPSSAAVNPALTIAAQALRVANHLAGRPPARGRPGGPAANG